MHFDRDKDTEMSDQSVQIAEMRETIRDLEGRVTYQGSERDRDGADKQSAINCLMRQLSDCRVEISDLTSRCTRAERDTAEHKVNSSNFLGRIFVACMLLRACVSSSSML